MIDPGRLLIYGLSVSIMIGAFVFVFKAPNYVQLILLTGLISAGIVGLVTYLLFVSISVALEQRIQNYMIWVAVISGLASAFVGAYLMTTILEVTTK